MALHKIMLSNFLYLCVNSTGFWIALSHRWNDVRLFGDCWKWNATLEQRSTIKCQPCNPRSLLNNGWCWQNIATENLIFTNCSQLYNFWWWSWKVKNNINMYLQYKNTYKIVWNRDRHISKICTFTYQDQLFPGQSTLFCIYLVVKVVGQVV